MSNPFETPEFKKLQQQWYKKLEKSGFDEQEQADGNLKKWSSYFKNTHSDPSKFWAKEEYFRLAGQFLWSNTWESKYDRLVWELHSDGLSNNAVMKALKAKRKPYQKTVVSEIIKKYAAMMLEEAKKSHE